MIEAEILEKLDNLANCVNADPGATRTHFLHLYQLLVEIHCPKTVEAAARRIDVELGESPPE